MTNDDSKKYSYYFQHRYPYYSSVRNQSLLILTTINDDLLVTAYHYEAQLKSQLTRNEES